MLLLTIAEHESNIEEARQDLAALCEFSPKRLFNYMDIEKDDKITADELVQFMFDNGMAGNDTTENIAREVIKEFDTELNGSLTYDEFLNVFLPSTNEKLRSVCIRRSEIDQHQEKEPHNFVLHMAAKILGYEKSLAQRKILYRQNLENVHSFEPYQAFQYLSLFSKGADAARACGRKPEQSLPEGPNVMLDIKAITNFLESSMVPAGSTFTALHPQHGSRLK